MGVIFVITLLSAIACIHGQTPSPNCADQLERMFECIEKLKTTSESQSLEKKKEAVLKKCVPDLPAQCIAIKKAVDQCQDQITKDASLISLRPEIKKNVSQCFEKYSSTWRRVYRRPQFPFVAFAGAPPQAPPIPPPPGMHFPTERDPCAPTESQMRCIKNEMRTDNEAHEIAERLEDKQRDCYKESDNEKCRVDGKPQLRECIEKSKEGFLQKAMAKMQECMQTSVNITLPITTPKTP